MGGGRKVPFFESMEIKGFFPLRWFGINGIVLWPFTLYAQKKPHPHVLNHERIHRDQIRRDGVLHFYQRYLREYFALRLKGMRHNDSYLHISYEQEAYSHQHDEEYRVC